MAGGVDFQPIPDERAAVATTDGRRLLVIADYHAGYEAGLRYERGVHVESRACERRERLLGLVDEADPDRLVVLGDLTHSIGAARGAERGEVETLIEALDVPVTLAKGNHDGEVEDWVAGITGPPVTVTPASGGVIGGLGIVHGHARPSPDVATADTVAVGHEHPHVRLADRVGGRRIEPAWVRGELDPMAIPAVAERLEAPPDHRPSLVLVPPFNERVGGTWVDGEDYLVPFLPEAMRDAEVYLLDGSRLGSVRQLRENRSGNTR